MSSNFIKDSNFEDRVISLAPGLPAIPERLLLAHARGEVLFIVGAGVSKASNLPDFRELVLDVYKMLDPAVHSIIVSIPQDHATPWSPEDNSLTNQQMAEVNRFHKRDYDVVLGMLERRIDGKTHVNSMVRKKISELLRHGAVKPAPIHKHLMRLADRGVGCSIATTNFDLLLESATRPHSESYSLGAIPRPGRTDEFSGVFHIHGLLDKNKNRYRDLIVSDHDFGEFYLRRRVVPDFIYDAARLFNIVLVGYSANDPPMRYLLNAVAADDMRFTDVKERFTFIGNAEPDLVEAEDWKGRGITPIMYDDSDSHKALSACLERWSLLSAINGRSTLIDKEIRRIIKFTRGESNDGDRDLFDHFLRRANINERVRISGMASKLKADITWLDAIVRVCSESSQDVSI